MNPARARLVVPTNASSVHHHIVHDDRADADERAAADGVAMLSVRLIGGRCAREAAVQCDYLATRDARASLFASAEFPSTAVALPIPSRCHRWRKNTAPLPLRMRRLDP